MNPITRDEWLRAVADAEGPLDQDAISAGELGAMLQIPSRTALDRLSRMVSTGKAVRTFKVVTDASGRRRRVTAFKLVKAPKKGR
jgi:hypothetical protein